VQGWQSNIMDHHPSRWMFIVRSENEAEAETVEPETEMIESEIPLESAPANETLDQAASADDDGEPEGRDS